MTDDILAIIYAAIDEQNERLAAVKRLPKQPETVLLGDSGALDSLGFISLVVSVEAKLADRFGTPVNLTEEEAMLDPGGPFRTVQSLADHVRVRMAAG